MRAGIWVKQFRNLAELFVSLLHHRQGIGVSLLNAAINCCRPISAKGLLRVNSSADAVDFYKKHGFVDINIDQLLPYHCVPLVYYF